MPSEPRVCRWSSSAAIKLCVECSILLVVFHPCFTILLLAAVGAIQASILLSMLFLLDIFVSSLILPAPFTSVLPPYKELTPLPLVMAKCSANGPKWVNPVSIDSTKALDS